MRKIFILMTLAVFLAFAASAQAAELKIGFFNMNEIGTSSDAYKANLASLQKEFEKEGQDLQKQAEAWQKKANDFKVQQQALSAEAREDRGSALNREKLELDDKLNRYARKRQTAEQRAQDQINRIIMYAANEVGKRENYSAIMEVNLAGAVMVDQKLDVGKAILQEANKVWKEKPKAVFGDGKK